MSSERRTGCYATVGFIAAMAGLFFWTLDHHVVWAILGLGVLLLCFVLSDATGSDNDE